MAGYSIWTFDIVVKHVTDAKRGGLIRVNETELLLWQECPLDWGYTKATDRARHLEQQTPDSAFVVRQRRDDGTLTDVSPEDWQRGTSLALGRASEQAGKARQKRQAKKIQRSGYTAGGDA
jgi:hypothetical protein